MMPYLNEDGSLDTWKGYIIKCDHCGHIEMVFDETTEEWVGRGELHYAAETEIRELFKGVRKPVIPSVLCVDCIRRIMPNLYRLRDVIELDIFANRLKGAINEKRKQGIKNHRTTADDACQCCERGAQRRPGH